MTSDDHVIKTVTGISFDVPFHQPETFEDRIRKYTSLTTLDDLSVELQGVYQKFKEKYKPEEISRRPEFVAYALRELYDYLFCIQMSTHRSPLFQTNREDVIILENKSIDRFMSEYLIECFIDRDKN